MKTHLNFATADLEKSVVFYAILLDRLPVKVLNDYALFVTDEPGLELALDRDEHVSPARDAHYGISVESIEEVDDAIARLESAGLTVSIEREVTCCYANQTKVWAADPEGRRWEIYTVHEESDVRDDDPDTPCCV